MASVSDSEYRAYSKLRHAVLAGILLQLIARRSLSVVKSTSASPLLASLLIQWHGLYLAKHQVPVVPPFPAHHFACNFGKAFCAALNLHKACSSKRTISPVSYQPRSISPEHSRRWALPVHLASPPADSRHYVRPFQLQASALFDTRNRHRRASIPGRIRPTVPGFAAIVR